MKKWKVYIGVFIIISLVSFKPASRKTTVFLVGDSTMANKETTAYPETGWGMPFAVFFDSTIAVENLAQNGRSTKSFIEEKRWQQVTDEAQPGDYVLIQFGHNDEVKEKVGRYTTPDEFTANLTRFVTETRNKQATPVLITPVARRKFDSTGHVLDTHKEYAALVRKVAMDEHVALVDLDAKSMELIQQFGPVNSTLLFDYLTPGEHPNYPAGNHDDTHFNELGARRMAELVLQEIRNINLPLAQHIIAKSK